MATKTYTGREGKSMATPTAGRVTMILGARNGGLWHDGGSDFARTLLRSRNEDQPMHLRAAKPLDWLQYQGADGLPLPGSRAERNLAAFGVGRLGLPAPAAPALEWDGCVSRDGKFRIVPSTTRKRGYDLLANGEAVWACQSIAHAKRVAQEQADAAVRATAQHEREQAWLQAAREGK